MLIDFSPKEQQKFYLKICRLRSFFIEALYSSQRLKLLFLRRLHSRFLSNI